MRHDSNDPLAEAIEGLPREIRPDHDLWPAISACLETAEEPATPWWRKAVAALFFFALGAGAMGLYSGVFVAEPSPSQSVELSPVETAPRFESMNPPRRESGLVPVALGVETDYLRARDAIWLYLLDHRDALPAGTIKVVEKNIEIIDRAIEDIRSALRRDPGNPDLQRRLMEHHQRSIDVLRTVANVV